jgi:hypothetical protein
MSEASSHERCELVSVLRTISHSGDHDILIEYSLIGLLGIFVESFHERIYRISVLDWHDTLSSFIVRCMERYSE